MPFKALLFLVGLGLGLIAAMALGGGVGVVAAYAAAGGVGAVLGEALVAYLLKRARQRLQDEAGKDTT